MFISARTLVFAVLIGLFASPALATSITIDVAGGDPAQNVESSGTFTGPDVNGIMTWELDQPYVIQEGGNELGVIDSWTSQLKDDPFVTNNITVSNTTGFTQNYIATILSPIPAFNYTEIVFSSVGLTATDSNNNNALLVDSPSSNLYSGLINSVTELVLNPPNLPLTTADCTPNPNTGGCSATDSDGVASMLAGPGVANDIGIALRFSLSAGDSVSVTSRFEVVPEPTTGLMLSLGLLGLAITRRR